MLSRCLRYGRGRVGTRKGGRPSWSALQPSRLCPPLIIVISRSIKQRHHAWKCLMRLGLLIPPNENTLETRLELTSLLLCHQQPFHREAFVF